MRFDIMTLFPQMVETVLNESIIGRAQKGDLISCYAHNIRDYSQNKHKRVDDTPYGGGMGMLMAAPPIYECYQDIINKNQNGDDYKRRVIYMSPKGTVLTQNKVKAFAELDNLIILCGHYEGVDQRIIDEIVDEEISIGDYVLTGGELPACILVDSVSRLVDGVLSHSDCHEDESISCGMLEYPHYTRPLEFRGRVVPEVLTSGHHANIEKWRYEQSLALTRMKRPDLLIKEANDLDSKQKR